MAEIRIDRGLGTLAADDASADDPADPGLGTLGTRAQRWRATRRISPESPVTGGADGFKLRAPVDFERNRVVPGQYRNCYRAAAAKQALPAVLPSVAVEPTRHRFDWQKLPATGRREPAAAGMVVVSGNHGAGNPELDCPVRQSANLSFSVSAALLLAGPVAQSAALAERDPDAG